METEFSTLLPGYRNLALSITDPAAQELILVLLDELAEAKEAIATLEDRLAK